MSAQKAQPLTKDEVIMLVEHLIALLPHAPVQSTGSGTSIARRETLRTPPTPKKIFISSASSKGKLNRDAAANDAKASAIARNRAIAEYYEEKKKIVPLIKRKLELEILELGKKLCPDLRDKNSCRDNKNND